ncbi:unnamed protein product [Closterium sp. NIES-53]
MIHASAPHFLWPYAVRYAAHQLNLQPRVSRTEASSTSLWTGSPGVGSAFRIWCCLALVYDTSADKLSARAIPCVFLGFLVDSPDYAFYHPPLHQFLDSRDVWFDESVSYYARYPCRGLLVPPPLLFLAPSPPPAPAPLSSSQSPQQPSTLPRQVTVDSGGVGAGGAATGGTRSRGALLRGAGVGGAGTGGASSGGVGAGGAGVGGASSGGVGAGGAGAGGASSGGAGAGGADAGGASSGGAGEGGTGTRCASSEETGAGGTNTAPPHRHDTPGAGAAAAAAGAAAAAAAAFAAAATFAAAVPTNSAPAVFSPPQSQSPPPVLLHNWTTRCPPRARPSSPFDDPRTVLFHSSPRRAPLVSILPPPPSSSLTVSTHPITDYYKDVHPVVSRVLASFVTNPRASSSFVSALTAAVADFASTRRLDFATRVVAAPPARPLSAGGEFALGCDVLEDRQFELEFPAAASPSLCAMLLFPEEGPAALDILTPRSVRTVGLSLESGHGLRDGVLEIHMHLRQFARGDLVASSAWLHWHFPAWDPVEPETTSLRSPLGAPSFSGLGFNTPPHSPFLDDPFDSSGPYPEIVGCLMYQMTCTRPDLTFPLSVLSRFVATVRHRRVHWTAAVRVAKYLASISGMGLMLGGRQPVYSVVVCGFVYARAMAAKELRWLTFLLSELGERPRSAPTLFADNKAMILESFPLLPNTGTPTALTVDLIEQHLLAVETSAVAVGAARGTPRSPFFEGCPPSPLAPSYASAAAADVSVAEDVGAAFASAKRRSSKGKGGRGGGGGSGGGGGGSGSGGGGSSGSSGGSGGGGGSGTGGGSGGFGGGGGGSGGSGGSGGGTLPGTAPAEALHTFTLDSGASRCFFRHSTNLTPLPAPVPVRMADFFGGPIVPRSSIVLPCPAVPSGSLSSLHLPSFSTNLVSTAALLDALVTTTTPGGQRVSICTCTRTRRHLATFTRWPGSNLYTLATEPPQVAASAQMSASGEVAASCSYRLLSHQNLLWHHRLGQPSRPRLRGMHSRLLGSGLPRSLPPLPPSPAPPCITCVEGRQHAAPHASSFPPTTAPLQTLHMDVWGPAHVTGQGRERYFLQVVDDYSKYTMVFPLRIKGQVVDVLIPWIRAVRLQLRERFSTDLPILRLHSDRGGEFSSNLSREFCRGEGILQSFTLPESSQKNGIAEHRIGLVMEVIRTSMIHAAAPHFLWSFAVPYAAHQLNLWPHVSLAETSPTLRWTGEVGDASVFWVWSSYAFVRDMSADKLSARAIPCVFLGFSVPFYRLFPYRSAPPPPPPLFLAPGPPPIDPLPPQGPAPSGVSQVDPLLGTAHVEVAVGSGAARGAASGGAASGGAELGGAESEGAGSGGAARGGEEPGGAEPEGVEHGGPAGASPRLSPDHPHEWLVRRARLRRGAIGAGGAGDAGAGGAGSTAGASGTGGTAAAGPGGVLELPGLGVDYFPTFSPTLKMTNLRVLLHVANQRDYELHSLDFSTAFLQGSLLEEILLRRPPGFTGSFPAGTQWSLRWSVYGLHQAPREWHDTLRTTIAALGFAPSTAYPSLFLRTDTSPPPFYVVVYVDDLVFATADTEVQTLVKSEMQKRHTCTDLVELRSYLGLQITRDRARRTITLTQSHMVHQVLQCLDFEFSLPQNTPLSTGDSLSAPPSDESVEPSGLYPELVGCLMYLMMCTGPDLAYPLSLLACYVAPGSHRKVHWDAAKRVLRYLCSTSGMGLVLGGRGPVVLTGHTDTSWVDDFATQRSSQGYTFSLGSDSVSWRSTRSSSVLTSNCEAEIYAGAMAVQELRWLTYLLTDLEE